MIVSILQYPHYPLPPVVEQLHSEGEGVERWDVCPRKTCEFVSKGWLVRLWGKKFLQWCFKFHKLKNKRIYATAGHLPLMAVARIFGRFMGDYHIYLDNFYLHGLGQKSTVKKILRWLINNPRVTIFTYSEKEVEYFRNLSSKPKVEFIPFCSDFKPITDKLPPLPEGDKLPENYIFTGGYTNRDYDLVINLAKRFPRQNFIIVASALNRLDQIEDKPENLRIFTDLPKEQFESLLAASTIVLIPLREDVGASGQMLAISALRNGKPTIYTDLSVINYFFTTHLDPRKDTTLFVEFRKGNEAAAQEDGSPAKRNDEASFADLATLEKTESEFAGIPYKLNDLNSISQALQTLIDNPGLQTQLSEAALKASTRFTISSQLKQLRKYL